MDVLEKISSKKSTSSFSMSVRNMRSYRKIAIFGDILIYKQHFEKKKTKVEKLNERLEALEKFQNNRPLRGLKKKI